MDLLKKYKVKLSTGGNTMYIPDLVKIQIDKNATDSKFKQEFYATFADDKRYLASLFMGAMKKAINKGGRATIPTKNQQTGKVDNVSYHVINGHMSSNGNFSFDNPSRPENE
jgi:hypothetical protein